MLVGSFAASQLHATVLESLPVRLQISALALAIAAATAPAAAADGAAAAPAHEAVAAAERAFAADGLARGVGPSFIAWAAPEAIVFRPDPVNARAYYAGHPAPGPGVLKWRPHRIGVARSGDLAFDTGPWEARGGEAHGWFFTIWKKQPDGTWKWVLDHGYDSAPASIGPDAPISRVPVSASGSRSPAAALEAVRAEEDALTAGLARGRLAAAYAPRLSEATWVAGLEKDGPAMTLEAVRAALAGRPQTMTVERLGGGASAAGDFAYTWGRARWAKDGKTVEGRFVRVWQKNSDGWKLLFDETTPS
jgi:ketosteroid isomerase-like protein